MRRSTNQSFSISPDASRLAREAVGPGPKGGNRDVTFPGVAPGTIRSETRLRLVAATNAWCEAYPVTGTEVLPPALQPRAQHYLARATTLAHAATVVRSIGRLCDGVIDGASGGYGVCGCKRCAGMVTRDFETTLRDTL